MEKIKLKNLPNKAFITITYKIFILKNLTVYISVEKIKLM